MADVFRVPRQVIHQTLDKMKRLGLIHTEAEFHHAAEDGLRREVTYRDRDFLYYLAKTSETDTVDSALDYLKSQNIAVENAAYDREAFQRHREAVKSCFKGSWTSITPVMERLMYMLASVHRPRRYLEIGSFWGNTLAWFAGPCVGPAKQYDADVIYGIELDPAMSRQAQENFHRLGDSESVRLIAGDARDLVESLEGGFDYLYLEAKSQETPELYFQMIKLLYHSLQPGAWVIAHDVFDPSNRSDLERYLSFVRDSRYFQRSLSFDVDYYGLELSIKRAEPGSVS